MSAETRGAAPVLEPTAWERVRGWRPSRAMVALALVILLALTVTTLLSPRRVGYLDPHAVDPTGSRAVANVLAEQGVSVVDSRRTEDVLAHAQGATVLVTQPQLPTHGVVSDLLAANPAWVVLVAPLPGDPLFDRLAAGVDPSGDVADEPLEPGCALSTATRAGTAVLPGWVYDTRAWGSYADGCYVSADRAGLVVLAPRADRPGVILLGSDNPLTNEGFDVEGNAALALGLLGAEPTLVWWRPTVDDPALAGSGQVQLRDLMPSWVIPVLVELAVAVVVLVWWRARRLGRLVIEPLPVVIRAGETTTGHGRLLHAQHARGEAARHLRDATRAHLGARLAVPPSSPPEALIGAVASRTRRTPGLVAALLYGADPADDHDLVVLAHELETLTDEVDRA